MTDNHEYNVPQEGASDWHIPLNENFRRLDTDVEIRDVESALDQYTPKDGAKFLATDTGKVFLADGSNWNRLAVSRSETEFDSIRANATSVADRDNEINVRALDGSTLSERVTNALQLIDTSGIVRIPRPVDGGKWTWGQQLDVDATQYKGITLDFDRGVKVEYANDGWCLTVTGPSNNAQNHTFAIDGAGAEFDASQASNPTGFVRADDIDHFTSKINTRSFTNNSGDAVAIRIRNVNNFSEGWRIEGDHRVCDIGIDFVPASQTGGSGGDSFVDGRMENVSVNYFETGIRLGGTHKGNVLDNVAFFARTDAATGIEFAGNNANVVFHGPRWDIADPSIAHTAMETTPEFDGSANGRPVLYNPSFKSVDNLISTSGEGDGVFFLDIVEKDDQPPGIQLYDPISDSGLFVGRGGDTRIFSQGTDHLRVRTGGVIDLGLENKVDVNDETLDNVAEVRYGTQRTVDPDTSVLDDGESMQYISDGTQSVTGNEGDLIWATNDGGSIKTLVLAAVSDAS